MNQVDTYINAAFRYVQGNPSEVEDAKLEMKTHLIESIQELKRAGLTEKEAISIAINRFGGIETMSSVARYQFGIQRIFAKRILLIAITTLLLTCLVALLLWRLDTQQDKDRKLLAQSIKSITASQTFISDETIALLQNQLEEHPSIINASLHQILRLDIASSNLSDTVDTTETIYVNYNTPDYYYESQRYVPEWQIVSHSYSFHDANWLISFEVARWFSFVPLVLGIGLAIYATLFTIWASINAYHHQRLKVYWIILFAATNVVGYGIYLLVEHAQQRKYRAYMPALG